MRRAYQPIPKRGMTRHDGIFGTHNQINVDQPRRLEIRQRQDG